MAGITVTKHSSFTRIQVKKPGDFLNDLAEELAPSPEFIKHANRVMNKIFRKLQEKSKFSIDRLGPGGGKEKKTSVSYSIDYDLVAFVNNVRPPFTAVLEDFKRIIHSYLHVNEEDIKQTTRSLRFTLDGIDFDLLPATNMAKSQDPGETWRKQRKALLAEIRLSRDPKDAASLHSAGLTETAVQFVKKQSSFVHKVARLAKGWNSTIICTEYFFGRSYIFELLGIQAGRKEEEANPFPSILGAFRSFLKMVKDIGQQRIIFSYSDDFCSESDTPDELLRKKPLILDPSNPYNNVMTNFHDSAQQFFSDCAKETLERLERVGEQIKMGHKSPDLKEIFLPQIRSSPGGSVLIPHRWLIGAELGTTRLQPKTVLRNDSLNKKRKSEIEHLQKAFSAYLFISNIEANYKRPIDRTMSALQSIQKSIDHLFGRGTETGQLDWSSSTDNHANYDVTFEIPIGPRGGDILIIISSNWS